MNDAKYIGMDVHTATISAGIPRRAAAQLARMSTELRELVAQFSTSGKHRVK